MSLACILKIKLDALHISNQVWIKTFSFLLLDKVFSHFFVYLFLKGHHYLEVTLKAWHPLRFVVLKNGANTCIFNFLTFFFLTGQASESVKQVPRLYGRASVITFYRKPYSTYKSASKILLVRYILLPMFLLFG